VTVFARVYDVQLDGSYIEAVQNTTLSTDGGLALVDGMLPYSPEWHTAIDAGRRRRIVLDGTITRVLMSGHNDYPEFEVEAGGDRTRWTRSVSRPYVGIGDAFYKVGQQVRLTYVEHPWKPGQPAEKILGTHARLVLSIDIASAT
jgi:hypothetical protein